MEVERMNESIDEVGRAVLGKMAFGSFYHVRPG
jgi:hypothetical protein